MPPKTVCKEIKEAAVRMAKVFRPNLVAIFLDISLRTVYNTLELHKATGSVEVPPTGIKRGRPPKLDENELSVCTLIITLTLTILSRCLKWLERMVALKN